MTVLIDPIDIRKTLALMLTECRNSDDESNIESWRRMLVDAGVGRPELVLEVGAGFQEQHPDGAAQALILGICTGIRLGRIDAAKMIEGD